MSSIPFASVGMISFMTMLDWDQESGVCGHGVPARVTPVSGSGQLARWWKLSVFHWKTALGGWNSRCLTRQHIPSFLSVHRVMDISARLLLIWS